MDNKPKRLIKGSEEAKAHMTKIRSLRGQKTKTESKPEPEIICPPCENQKPKRSKKDLIVDFS